MQNNATLRGKQTVIMTVAAGLALMLLFSFMSKSQQPSQQARPSAQNSAQSRESNPAGATISEEQSGHIQHLMKSLNEDPNDTEALYGLGELFLDMDSLDKAAFFLERLIKLQPENKDALYLYGVVQLKQDKTMQSVETFEKVVKLDPGHFHSYYYLGMILRHELGQKEKGAEYLQKILEINPDHKELIDTVKQELARK
ncbi:MAG: hypothetical protein BA863_17465 [Desulfovibrio sp. S3730MH75]|nr:MAG: hypothetical protein BA863_17465 [Desulfovibrio sp. S3730MH75]